MSKTKRTRMLIVELYAIVAELEKMYKGRKFTLDGHLVGSIGEVYAASKYKYDLLKSSAKTHDAKDKKTGRLWQIKTTQGKQIGIRSKPNNLLVLKLEKDGSMTTIYEGSGNAAWNASGKMNSNGQRYISLEKLNDLSKKSKRPSK